MKCKKHNIELTKQYQGGGKWTFYCKECEQDKVKPFLNGILENRAMEHKLVARTR